MTVDDEAPVTADTVDRILRSQILDMQDAARTGVLNDEYRYFGTTVERCGHHERATSDHWFNFDPATFIECGIVGTFGGWEDSDDTGRELVPGDVAGIGTDGEITTVSAEECVDEVVPLDVLSWSVIADFLWAGQHYE